MTATPDLLVEAAEAIRAANHATITHYGDQLAQDLSSCVSLLAYTAHGIEQLIDQLAANAARRVDTGRETGCLRHDAGGDPIDTLIDAIAILRHATDHAGRAGRALSQAHNLFNHIADTEDLPR